MRAGSAACRVGKAVGVSWTVRTVALVPVGACVAQASGGVRARGGPFRTLQAGICMLVKVSIAYTSGMRSGILGIWRTVA